MLWCATRGTLKIEIQHLPMFNCPQFRIPCSCRNDNLFLSILKITFISNILSPEISHPSWMASNLERKKENGKQTWRENATHIVWQNPTHLRTGCRQTLDAAALEMPAETDTTVTGNLKCEPWAHSELTRPANKGSHGQRPTLRHAMGTQTNHSAHN